MHEKTQLNGVNLFFLWFGAAVSVAEILTGGYLAELGAVKGIWAILLGGFISYLVGRSSRDGKISKERQERGILVASGYIAGGSIAGVAAAVIAALHWDAFLAVHYSDSLSELVAIAMLTLLSVFMYLYSKRTRS